MSHRFEIVRTAAGFHSRFVASNGKLVWVTEPYLRRRAAVAAIERICASTITTSPFAAHPEIAWAGQEHPTEVRDVDERPEPPAPFVIEAPFYLTHHTGFWHDHDYHYRHCHSGECAQRTPPAGTHVRGRLGIVTYQEKP